MIKLALTTRDFHDICVNMAAAKPSFESTLRELVRAKGLRQTARALNIAPESLYRSLLEGSNIKLGRIKALLDYLGYEIRLVKKRRERR